MLPTRSSSSDPDAEDGTSWSRSDYSASSVSFPDSAASNKPTPVPDDIHSRITFDVVLSSLDTSTPIFARSRSMDHLPSLESRHESSLPSSSTAASTSSSSSPPRQAAPVRVSRFVEHLDFEPDVHRLVFVPARGATRSVVRRPLKSSTAPPRDSFDDHHHSALEHEETTAEPSSLVGIALSDSATTTSTPEEKDHLNSVAFEGGVTGARFTSTMALSQPPPARPPRSMSRTNSTKRSSSPSTPMHGEPSSSSARVQPVDAHGAFQTHETGRHPASSSAGASGDFRDGVALSHGRTSQQPSDTSRSRPDSPEWESDAKQGSRPASPPVPARSPLRRQNFESFRSAMSNASDPELMASTPGHGHDVDRPASSTTAQVLTHRLLPLDTASLPALSPRSASPDTMPGLDTEKRSDVNTTTRTPLSASSSKAHARGFSLPKFGFSPSSPSGSSKPPVFVPPSFASSSRSSLNESVGAEDGHGSAKRTYRVPTSWRRFLPNGTLLSPHSEVQVAPKPASVVGVLPPMAEDDVVIPEETAAAAASQALYVETNHEESASSIVVSSTALVTEMTSAPRPIVQRLFSAPPNVSAALDDGEAGTPLSPNASAHALLANLALKGIDVHSLAPPPVQRKLHKPRVSESEKARRAKVAKEAEEWEERRRVERSQPRGFVKGVLLARTN